MSPTMTTLVDILNAAHRSIGSSWEDIEDVVSIARRVIAKASCYEWSAALSYALDDLAETVKRHPEAMRTDVLRIEETVRVYEAREPRASFI